MGTAVAALCAIAVLVAWLRSEEPAAAPIPPPPALPGPRLTEAPKLPDAPAPSPLARPEPAPKANAAPIIDEILVEKPEVCEGEENLITIRAHTPDGTDAFLHYTVGGQTGQRVPVRSYLADDGEPPRLRVSVFGRNNVSTVVDAPPFVVKRCKPPLAAFVTAGLRANSWSEFDFAVKIVEPVGSDGGAGSGFRPRSYEWSFGDGETAVTSVPYVTHNYEGRRQDKMYAHLLVEVKVHGNADSPVIGRTALQLLNSAFEDLAFKGVVSLMVQLTPRFPELGTDGVVRQKVRLFHHRDRPVFIHQVLVFRHRMDPREPVAPIAEDPAALMGTSMIPPGFGVEFEIRFDTRRYADVFSEERNVEGKDSEGLPVRGTFSIMRPPPRPTRENSNPVQDPMLKAKILAARKILNKPFVTDEDLWRLEREGKFADIGAQVGAAPDRGRPAMDGRSEPEPDPGPPPPGPRAAPSFQENRPPGATSKPPTR